MRKIVIANQKGGVAKTTTAVNLSAGLALKGRQTLLIDMDPQANATFAVLGPHHSETSVYDLLIKDRPFIEVVQRTPQPLLDILPSDINLAGAEVELISRVGGQTLLGTRLLEAADEIHYDYIIIDAPPSLGFLTINALAAADEVFIPVSTSIFALNGITMLENTINQVRRSLNRPTLKVTGVLCTMFENTNVGRDVVAATQEHFKEVMFQTVIPKNIKLEEAHSRVESIFTYANDSKGAEAYRELVEEVVSREFKNNAI
jgi:chromosome partitioning protein